MGAEMNQKKARSETGGSAKESRVSAMVTAPARPAIWMAPGQTMALVGAAGCGMASAGALMASCWAVICWSICSRSSSESRTCGAPQFQQ